MEFVKANINDIEQIEYLLYQVHDTHAVGRPDIFKKGIKKYTKEEITNIINNDDTPVYVLKDNDKIIAHAFIKYEYNIKKDMYIDDICVDKSYRHQGLSKLILSNLEKIAKDNDCYRMTLNVYIFNKAAVECYKKFGMEPYSMHMEKILDKVEK